MLCLPLAALNASATLAPSPQPRRKHPSRAAGSCFHHVEPFAIGEPDGRQAPTLRTFRFVGIIARVMPGSISTALTWTFLMLVPPIAGYWLAKVRSPRVRLPLLALFLSTPIILLTTAMTLLPSAPPSDFGWWMAGMIMISPAIVIWAMLAGTGYVVSRRQVR